MATGEDSAGKQWEAKRAVKSLALPILPLPFSPSPMAQQNRKIRKICFLRARFKRKHWISGECRATGRRNANRGSLSTTSSDNARTPRFKSAVISVRALLARVLLTQTREL